MHASRPPQAEETTPAPRHWALLPGARFADSFRIPLTPELAPLDTTEIAARMMAEQPGWISALMRVRDLLVAPLGLKRAGDHGAPAGFPLLLVEPARVVMGLDDSHLDFRLCVEKLEAGGREGSAGPGWLTVTTVVRTKRLLGSVYLAAIMPFPRRIARTLLQGVARSHPDKPAASMQQ